MQTQKYTIRFNTPAFLGNAEQNGQWRTPPFKAQLRQWWRVAYAAKHAFRVNVADMRREEGLLFGNAWLQDEFRKSQVRLRLDRWDQGRLESWQRLEQKTVFHPETQQTKFQVGPHAYLAFGPLDGRKGTQLKCNAAIQADEFATLSLAYPKESATLIEQALCLMHCYGTVGGRSRNGWGSYELSSSHSGRGAGGEGVPLRNWRACLDRDWPHAIGRDEKGPLIWQTTEHDNWQQLMRTLAIIKIGLRTQFVFPSVKPPHPSPLPRHWLSYPITHHTTTAFDRNARLPNSLRFKVRRQGDKLVGVIFHMPCLPPPAFAPHLTTIIDVWQCVHAFLDALGHSPARRTYCQLADNDALNAQSSQLARVTLERIPE
jgi:CRISPR-associated protein Cmr1